MQWSYRPAAAVSLAGKSVGAVPRPLSGKSIAGQGWHAPLQLIRKTRITQAEVVARNRSARLPNPELRRRAQTAAAVRHDHCVWRLDDIGRSQPSRPAGFIAHELRGEGSDRGDHGNHDP
jgi:hypothetical protein